MESGIAIQTSFVDGARGNARNVERSAWRSGQSLNVPTPMSARGTPKSEWMTCRVSTEDPCRDYYESAELDPLPSSSRRWSTIRGVSNASVARERPTRTIMTGRQNARDMLEEAERSAIAGDLASAERLLRSAVQLQEAELGPLDPDLAYTLNNLAVVSERAGRPDEAEAFYRRATAIAAAALPADDPMVVTSRKNLEDFCHMRGLSMDAPGPATGPPHKAADGLDAFVSEHVIDELEMPTVANREVAPAPLTAPEPSPVPAAAVDEFTAAAAPPEPSRPLRVSHSLAWATTGVAALAAAVLLTVRPWSSLTML